ncbi:MAG: hypothetical protein MRY32_00580 [Rickettsiales bacterium]|nr:hypothetical protein [Rickettsiales bacterium]
MADSFHFDSLNDAAEHLSSALDFLLYEIGDGQISVVNTESYAEIQRQCQTVADAMSDVRQYREHFENETTADDRELPTRKQLKKFYAKISGEVNGLLALGLEGSDEALEVMLGRALSHEDDQLLASDDHLSHGAVLVEVDQPARFLHQMEGQLAYVLKGVASHFVEEGQSTSLDGKLTGSANSNNLTDISYEGLAAKRDHTLQL